jgi:hypothetical protein
MRKEPFSWGLFSLEAPINATCQKPALDLRSNLIGMINKNRKLALAPETGHAKAFLGPMID